MHETPVSADTLHVVVAATPDQEPDRPAPERVHAQRAGARTALSKAASIAGCPDAAFEKSSPRGRPVPTAGGWHWSISHDRTLVAAAVWRHGPVGVDLERIELRRRLLVERVSTAEERELLGETEEVPLDALGFARLWTTKEAVVKAEGIGLPGMQNCRIVAVPGRAFVRATYAGAPRDVWQTTVGGELVSACILGVSPARVVWHTRS
ncbi:MAG: 4'-phosphopantetheinyl transferase superfamily protein [Planctomycetota bacterium]